MNIPSFGNSKASFILMDKLEVLQDDRTTSKVSRVYNQFCTGLNALNDIRDVGMYIHMCQILVNDWKDKVELDLNIDSSIRTYLSNCISSTYRVKLLEGLKVKVTPELYNRYKHQMGKLEKR